MKALDNKYRHFLAAWIYTNEQAKSGTPPFLWLCLREDVQAPYLEQADALVDEWLANERKQEESRSLPVAAIIRIDYTEGDQSSYSGVTLTIQGEQVAHYDTGDPVADFSEMLWFAQGKAHRIMLSSSCDHFVTDGNKYGWKETEIGEVLYRLSDNEIARYHRHPL